MRIFIIARGVPSKREPQWGNFELDQALALKNLGHDIVILSVDTRFRTYYRKFGITKHIMEEIPCYNLFAGSFWGNALRKMYMPAHIKVKQKLMLCLVNKVIEQEGLPDIVYGHYLSGCNMALAVKRKYGIPAVGMEHWSELGYSSIKKPIMKVASETYPFMDCQLVVSSALRENIKKNVGVDTYVVNNMVGREFKYVPTEKVDDIVRFVTTGNLLPVKGFDNLIQAFDIAKLPTEKWELNIIGGGKEYDKLQEMIENFGLRQNIHLCGRKSREGVIDTLHKSNVYVMSSRSETFGVAAIEALACGLPIIATECGGARDFVTDENGRLCQIENNVQLSDAISYMFSNYQNYDRQKIAEDCQLRFSSQAIGRQIETIFKQIIG